MGTGFRVLCRGRSGGDGLCPGGSQIAKVLAEGKFSFVTTTRGAFYAAGAGDYAVENDTYIEIPALASHSEMIGSRYVFQFRLEGDTWENSRWQNGVLVEHEVWKRVQITR